MVAFTAVERMRLKNAVEKALHVPGNYSDGNLEMAMVFDCNLSKEFITQVGKEMASILKSHSEVFRNVRMNALQWRSDNELIKEISSLPLIQMGRYFEDYERIQSVKQIEILAEQLKIFYARSKIIILITDGEYIVGDNELLKNSLQPFLYRKLIMITGTNETIEKVGFI